MTLTASKSEMRSAVPQRRESPLAESQRIAKLGSWEVDLVTSTVSWSAEMFEIYGLSSRDRAPTPQECLATVHVDDRDLSNGAFAAALKGESPLDYIHRVVPLGGPIRYVHVRGEISFGADGAAVRAAGIAQDVTGAVLREQELRASEERLKAIFSAMSEGLVIQDRYGSIVDSNSAAETILGLTKDQLCGKTSCDPEWRAVREDGSAYPGDEHPAMVTLRTGQALRDQIMGIEDPRRGRRWISINSSPIRSQDLHVREAVVTTFVDITRRLESERRLASVSRDMLDLYNHAPCGYHSLDAEGRFLLVNDTELAWLGCARSELIGKMRPTDFFTEDGKEQFRRCFPQLLVDGEIHNLEFDLIGRDRPLRKVSVSATTATDEDGNFVMTRGVMHDVTEIHHSRNELQKMALDQQAMLDSDLIGIVKLRNRQAIWTNRALGRIFGYEANELLGKPSRVLYCDEESCRAIGDLAYPALTRGEQYRTQLEMMRKDGARIWIDLSGALLSAETGEAMWMMADITALKRHEQQIERMLHHDSLTSIPNRILLADRARQALALAQRHGYLTAICYLDLDGFKQVNDKFGHASGDRLLTEVARRLSALLRSNDTVARLGGDEFVLLLTHMSNKDEYKAVLERTLAEISRPFVLEGGRTARISASIGVAISPQHGTGVDELMKNADAAMYVAKNLGRNRISVFQSK